MLARVGHVITPPSPSCGLILRFLLPSAECFLLCGFCPFLRPSLLLSQSRRLRAFCPSLAKGFLASVFDRNSIPAILNVWSEARNGNSANLASYLRPSCSLFLFLC